MDPRQRLNDPTLAPMMEARKRQSQMWTALPGIIQSFDPAKMTAEIQPSIQGVEIDPQAGTTANKPLPLLVDCPVCFPGFGDAVLTFPIAQGDECLILFSSRCIDAWWQQGGVQPPMSYRMHSLSDGFCIPGGRSQPNVIPNISTGTAQLRSRDGETFIELDPAAKKVRIVAEGGIELVGPVSLGGDGGAAVARVGDPVSGGVISTGSETVTAV
ncbi:Gp138 family membrane-puncturing spike protein [Sphingomonas sp. H39-1-10]|uniref:Gp138 family membrane-puncturing spike protein n=1 Tax=Sphingomonas pollutisoli TaxID=3030829 RepID=UPI0023B9E28D|nr:Gp138 family membrane-puncturing spike protein [Sphingomonas pollutisoli]MDF0491605.1 Gp138 family membrane-puncturing spike protein [Sphingomonas pollutisoli]